MLSTLPGMMGRQISFQTLSSGSTVPFPGEPCYRSNYREPAVAQGPCKGGSCSRRQSLLMAVTTLPPRLTLPLGSAKHHLSLNRCTRKRRELITQSRGQGLKAWFTPSVGPSFPERALVWPLTHWRSPAIISDRSPCLSSAAFWKTSELFLGKCSHKPVSGNAWQSTRPPESWSLRDTYWNMHGWNDTESGIYLWTKLVGGGGWVQVKLAWPGVNNCWRWVMGTSGFVIYSSVYFYLVLLI